MKLKKTFANILPSEKLDLFIERIGKVNLTQLKDDIIKKNNL